MDVAGAAGPAGGGEGVGAGAGGGGVGGEGGGGAFVAHPDRLPSISEWRRLLKRIEKKRKRAAAYESLVVHILRNWDSVNRNQAHGMMLAIDRAYGRQPEVLRM